MGKIEYISTLAKPVAAEGKYGNDHTRLTAWGFVIWAPCGSLSASAGQSAQGEAHPCPWKGWWWQPNLGHPVRRPPPPGNQEGKWTWLKSIRLPGLRGDRWQCAKDTTGKNNNDRVYSEVQRMLRRKGVCSVLIILFSAVWRTIDFFPVYWDLIDIQHCTGLRCTGKWHISKYCETITQV